MGVGERHYEKVVTVTLEMLFKTTLPIAYRYPQRHYEKAVMVTLACPMAEGITKKIINSADIDLFSIEIWDIIVKERIKW